MTGTGYYMASVVGSQFDEEFKDWFAEGSMTTVLYVVVVLAVIGIVVKAVS